ncbi:hypothetical protein D3C73_1329220 [compost metagenome]
MPGNGAMPILPDNIGTDITARLTPAPQQQHRPRTFQRMALGNEVVLPAYTAEHPPVFQLIRHTGA